MADRHLRFVGTARSVADPKPEPSDRRQHTRTTRSGADGEFAFEVPTEALTKAAIGAHLDGVAPVDLEPAGGRLEPGDLVLMVDDIVPSFIRYAG